LEKKPNTNQPPNPARGEKHVAIAVCYTDGVAEVPVCYQLQLEGTVLRPGRGREFLPEYCKCPCPDCQKPKPPPTPSWILEPRLPAAHLSEFRAFPRQRLSNQPCTKPGVSEKLGEG